VGKADYEEFVNRSAGKKVISEEDYTLLLGMEASINRHAGASMLLQMEGAAEESFFWVDERTGVHCKCRPDWRIPSRHILVDLKTCEDASPEAFARSIFNFTYHIQASFYLDGVRSVLAEPYSTFIFIAVEKKHPFAVAVYQLDADDIDKGRMEQENLLRLFKWCQENDSWPGYPEEIQTIKMPGWANAKEVAIYE
jgi:exodeoxyribonuclease VIII